MKTNRACKETDIAPNNTPLTMNRCIYITGLFYVKWDYTQIIQHLKRESWSRH